MRLFQRILLIGLAFVALKMNAYAALRGEASWYGAAFKGKLMANGKPYDPEGFTCACWFYPLGTRLKVTADNGKSVIVEVTDRGPAKRLTKDGRIIDLSRAAFAYLARPGLGLLKVTVETL